ncbi:glyoxalase superfamily protein [Roseovarius ramblicola]|uniref:Glyoxalase superfamily protein n=1 Tax=Roseovarius ramblicola TaxID=2022336 RepID=A0ABV5I0L2_9RHOB
MTNTTLPNRGALKDHARRLRATLADQGTALSHSAALETISRQWGFRDWNTLSAALCNAPAPRWQVGQAVSGRYLGHGFTGRIKAVREATGSHRHLTIVFDRPVDVVRSDWFSSYRRQINCIVNDAGHTLAKTSDGQPHVVLDAA